MEVAGEVEITADSTLVRGPGLCVAQQCTCSSFAVGTPEPSVIRVLSRRKHTLFHSALPRPRWQLPPLRRARSLYQKSHSVRHQHSVTGLLAWAGHGPSLREDSAARTPLICSWPLAQDAHSTLSLSLRRACLAPECLLVWATVCLLR